MKTRREFHEDEFHEDDDERREIPDGHGVRVPLMFADEKPPITWARGRPIRDSAPPEFDWTAFHRPGFRDASMMRDARRWLDGQDAGADPAAAARAQRIARQSTMWRDQTWSGGQSSNGDDEALEGEQERANATQGAVYPPDDDAPDDDAAEVARNAYKLRVGNMRKAGLPNYDVPQSSQESGGGQYRGGPLLPEMGKRAVPPGGQSWNAGHRPGSGVSALNRAGLPDAAAAYDDRSRRLTDAWRNPPGTCIEASVTDTMRPVTAPVADRRGTPIRDDRDAAYAAKTKRLEDAWRTAP